MIIRHSDSDDQLRFELLDNGQRAAWLVYSKPEADLFQVDHVYVSEGYQGRGLGRRVVDEFASFARGAECLVRAECPVAKHVLSQGEQFSDIYR